MPTFVQLLGSPAVQHEGDWHSLPKGLAAALIYHLAYEGSWKTREELAYLLWADRPEEKARKNLRNLLGRIKKLPFTESLEIEPSRIRWQVETDVATFKELVVKKDCTKVIQTYQGGLLASFHLDDSVEFSEWLEQERADLLQSYQKAILPHVEELESQEKFLEVAEVLETVQKHDPFNEEVLRRQLQNLHLAKQSSRALTSFEQFKNYLIEEFDAEPELKTLELIERIQRTQNDAPLQAAAKDKTESLPEPKVLHNLPNQLTPFVGREVEQKRIIEQLIDPACRLLTLVAPGGMGKTRLALAAASLSLEHFQEGVCFVPLASVSAPEQMIYAITDALNLSLTGKQEPKDQLLNYLKNKEMLLVLDNLEQLTDGLTLISDILENASNIKVLATSRERLQLRAEWLFDLRGLTYPLENQDLDSKDKSYDALDLFVQSAKRIDANFSLSSTTTQSVIRVCQLVAGMPLAIELAAGWLQLLSPDELFAELRGGIDLLESSERDRPQQHQSIRAVFDTSWQFLSRKEQEALSKLAVFRGGFSREAASDVAGASLPVLANLVRKSFLTRSQSGRYERHPLIYQYSHEKLQERPDYSEVRERHKRFYSKALEDWQEAINSGKQPETFQLIEAELDNIRQAVYWAAREKKFPEMQVAIKPLETFFVQAGRFHEGLELFEIALNNLDVSNDTDQAVKGKVLVSQAHLYLRVGQFDKTIEAAEQGAKLLKAAGDKHRLPGAYNMLGIAAIAKGNYPEAKLQFEKALMLAKAEGLRTRAASYTHNLGFVLADLGFYDKAEALYHVALNFYEQNSNFISQTRALIDLGELRLIQENYPDAKAFFQRGLTISKEANFQQPIAPLLNGLAKCALGVADYAGAERLADEAKRHSRISGEETVHIEALEILGRVMLVTNRLEQAQSYLLEALKAAWTINGLRQIPPTLLTLSSLKARQGEVGLAQTLVKAVLSHAASNQAHKARAERLLSEITADYGPDSMLDVVESDKLLEALVEAVLSLNPLKNP